MPAQPKPTSKNGFVIVFAEKIKNFNGISDFQKLRQNIFLVAQKSSSFLPTLFHVVLGTRFGKPILLLLSAKRIPPQSYFFCRSLEKKQRQKKLQKVVVFFWPKSICFGSELPFKN